MDRHVTIRIFPAFGNAYNASLVIDDTFDVEDAEEQVDAWLNDNLINARDWEWVSLY